MQVNLRVLPTKVFFFQTRTVFFSTIFTYVIFQDQSEDDIVDITGEEDIIDVIVTIVH